MLPRSCLSAVVVMAVCGVPPHAEEPVDQGLVGIEIGSGVGRGTKTGSIKVPEQYVRLAAEYDLDRLAGILEDRESAKRFAAEAVYRRQLAVDVMSQALGKLSAEKPEDQHIACCLIKGLTELKANIDTSQLLRFYTVVDPEVAAAVAEGAPKVFTDEERAALEWFRRQQEMTEKYPVKAALEQMGDEAIPVLHTMILTDPADSLRVRLAIHSFMTLASPAKVTSWISRSPELRKDWKRKAAIVRVARIIEERYFSKQ